MKKSKLTAALAFGIMLPVALVGATSAIAKDDKKDAGVVKGAAKGAAVGAIIPGVGVATGAAVGAVSGGVKKAGEENDKKEKKD